MDWHSYLAGLVTLPALATLALALGHTLNAVTLTASRHRPAFDRVTVDPEQMGGVPCIRHLRIPVVTVWLMVRDGRPMAEIRRDYPDLDEADVRQAVDYVRSARVVARATHEGGAL